MRKRIAGSLDEADLGFAREYGAKHDVPVSRVIQIALWRLRENPTEPLFGEKWFGGSRYGGVPATRGSSI